MKLKILVVSLIATYSIHGMDFISNFFGKKELTLDEVKKQAEELYQLQAQLSYEKVNFDIEGYNTKLTNLTNEIAALEAEQLLRKKNKNNDKQLEIKIDKAEALLLEKRLQKHSKTEFEIWQNDVFDLGNKYATLLEEYENRIRDESLEQQRLELVKKKEDVQKTNKIPGLESAIKEIQDICADGIKKAMEEGLVLAYDAWLEKNPYTPSKIIESIQEGETELEDVEGFKEIKKKAIIQDISIEEQLKNLIKNGYGSSRKDFIRKLRTLRKKIKSISMKPTDFVACLTILRQHQMREKQIIKNKYLHADFCDQVKGHDKKANMEELNKLDEKSSRNFIESLLLSASKVKIVKMKKRLQFLKNKTYN